MLLNHSYFSFICYRTIIVPIIIIIRCSPPPLPTLPPSPPIIIIRCSPPYPPYHPPPSPHSPCTPTIHSFPSNPPHRPPAPPLPNPTLPPSPPPLTELYLNLVGWPAAPPPSHEQTIIHCATSWESLGGGGGHGGWGGRRGGVITRQHTQLNSSH